VILNINIGIVEDAFHEAKHRSSALHNAVCGKLLVNSSHSSTLVGKLDMLEDVRVEHSGISIAAILM
jgi:hypothetical protein